MIFLHLFWEFFKTGLFAVGGGMATLPFLSRMADKTGWFTQAQLGDMVAVAESTPGPIGVNTATYVGMVTAGVPGAVIATLGLITPSILIILVIARFLKAYRDSRLVNSVFYGLRPASVALISSAGLTLTLQALFPVTSWSAITGAEGVAILKRLGLAAVLVILTRFVPKTRKFHPLVWILLSAVVGIALSF